MRSMPKLDANPVIRQTSSTQRQPSYESHPS